MMNNVCYCTNPECGVVFSDHQSRCIFCDSLTKAMPAPALKSGADDLKRVPYCLCSSCLGTSIKDEPCRAAALQAASIPLEDWVGVVGKPDTDIIDLLRRREPKFARGGNTTTRHPLINIAEWRKGCTCAPKESPAECIDCTVGLITAVENWFAERDEQWMPLGKLRVQVTAVRDYLSEHGLGTWGADCLPEALDLLKKHVPLPGATIELRSQPVIALADRLAVAICGDRQIEGFDVELLSHGMAGSRLSALIVEMAGHEAEAYALQDTVDEANASVTALEQRLADADRLLRALMTGVRHEGWSVGINVCAGADVWLEGK